MGRLFCGGGGCFAEIQSGGQGASEASPQREEAGGGGVVAGECRGSAGGGAPAGRPGEAGAGGLRPPKPSAGRFALRARARLAQGAGGESERAAGPAAQPPTRAQPVCFDAVETACGRLPAPLHKKAAHRLPLSRARAPQMRFQITFCFSHFPLKYRGR